MHVVFPAMGLSKAGGVRVLIELANGLVRRGHGVCILVARPSEAPSFPVDDRVTIQQVEARRSLLAESLWLVRHIPQDADAVVANYYPTAYPTAMAQCLGRPPGYYYIQGYEPWFFESAPHRRSPMLQRLLAKGSYRLPLRKIAVSTSLRQQLTRSTDRQIPVIPAGVDTDVFTAQPALRAQMHQLTVMTIGSTAPGKGLSDFLESVHHLAKRTADLHVTIATQDRQLVASAPVPTEIVHPSDDAELARCYGRASVFVFPSIREGFGLPPLEAMACGTPVVTTDCGGVRDYAKDGVNCLMVPAGDPHKMAEAVGKILVSEELSAQLSQGGMETARHFTWDKAVDKFESILLGDSAGKGAV